MKTVFIENFKTKETYTTELATQKKQTRTTREGRPYLILELKDRTGQISARMWEEVPKELLWADIETNKVYEVEGRVEEYQGKKQFIITHINLVDTFKKSDFLPIIKEDPEELFKELRSIHSKIKNDFIKKLVNSFFEDETFQNAFKEAPAAKSIHDSSLGGLLRHTTRMTNLAMDTIKRYPEIDINQDLVICGIAFHDMEKIHEYNFDGAVVEYSDTGRFIGHTVMACNKIYAKIREIDGFPKEIEDQILHIIAAHAGEYDPIRLPSTLEANLVHLVDFMDSRLIHFQQEKESAEEEQTWKKDYYSDSWMFFGKNNKKKEDSSSNALL